MLLFEKKFGVQLSLFAFLEKFIRNEETDNVNESPKEKLKKKLSFKLQVELSWYWNFQFGKWIFTDVNYKKMWRNLELLNEKSEIRTIQKAHKRLGKSRLLHTVYSVEMLSNLRADLLPSRSQRECS